MLCSSIHALLAQLRLRAKNGFFALGVAEQPQRLLRTLPKRLSAIAHSTSSLPR
jgi:hypothetical protein